MAPPTFISYGAGVQSTALLLLALEGRLNPAPQAAIFADTQWEPRAVYQHLWSMGELCSEHGFPLHVVTAGDLRADSLDDEVSFAKMPLYQQKGSGMLRRQCTREYKIAPMGKEMRRILGYEPRQRMPKVHVYLGISVDEVERARPSRIGWQENRFPLLDLGWRRSDCLQYLQDKGVVTPPKSSCIGCPYHSNRYWLDMKNNRPEEWADVLEFDDRVRDLHLRATGKKPISLYVHRSGTPMRTADLQESQGDLFANECDGYCFL